VRPYWPGAGARQQHAAGGIGMWNLLGNLIKGFLLLRDFFGYVIPGSVLLAIVARCLGGVDISHPPLAADSISVTATLAITASYIIGHVLVAVGYSLYDGFDLAWEKLKRPRPPTQGAPTEANVLYYRYLYPSMFTEADRRETLSILRVGLAVALLAGGFLPHSHLAKALAIAVGLFMLWNGYLSRQRAAAYRNSTIDAARLAKANNIPIFHWSGDGGADDDKDDKPAEAAGKAEASSPP
jgi:hypothetical protein